MIIFVCVFSMNNTFEFIKLIHFLNFSDFTTPAKFDVENGRIFLVHNGIKFIRYGSNENTRYWRCRHSFKYHCNARISTKVINCREMLEIQDEHHDHNRLRKK